MVQRFRLIAVAILAIVAFTVMLNVGNVYAQTVVLTPNPVTAGTSVMATGSVFSFRRYRSTYVVSSQHGCLLGFGVRPRVAVYCQWRWRFRD